MLKALLFDFDQTLVHSAGGFRDAEQWVQRELGDWLEAGDRAAFREVYREFRRMPGGTSPAGKARQWSAVCRHFGAEPAAPVLARWKAGYWARVAAGTRLLAETLPVLEKAGRTLALGLLTNGPTDREQGVGRDASRRLLGLFGAVVRAGRNGIPPKPDPAGFAALLSALGVSAGEAVYVGDDGNDDVCGARAAGILPVWLRHREIRRRPATESPAGVPRIESLLPLARLRPGDSPAEIRRKLAPKPGAARPGRPGNLSSECQPQPDHAQP